MASEGRSTPQRVSDAADTLADDGASALDDVALAPGTQVGEYKVVALLGEGSYGTVVRAVHPVIGKAAAIKVLKRQFSANAEVVSRFVDEARAVNQIRHRNIIDVFSFGVLPDGRHYAVMELLEGETLEERVCRGAMSVEEAAPILRQLARALGAAHAAGIAHRDLKPENVFLARDEDGAPIVKLLDFGIAKLLDDERKAASKHKTRSGVPMGTPLYMSPEQAEGAEVDQRVDIYALGCVIHEMLSGQVLFDGQSVLEVMVKHTSHAPPPLSSVCPGLGEALDAPLLRMLAKDPNDRPRSIIGAVDALLRAADLPGVAPPGIPSSAGALSASHPRVAVASTLSSDGARSDPSRTLRGSTTDVGRKGRVQRGALIAALGTLAVVAGLIVLRSSFSAVEPEPRDGAPADPPPSLREAAEEPPSAVTSVSTPLAPSERVRVLVVSEPAEAEVFHGETPLGKAGSPIEVPRGEPAWAITVRKAGFAPKQLMVEREENSEHHVTLRALEAPKPRSTVPEELLF